MGNRHDGSLRVSDRLDKHGFGTFQKHRTHGDSGFDSMYDGVIDEVLMEKMISAGMRLRLATEQIGRAADFEADGLLLLRRNPLLRKIS